MKIHLYLTVCRIVIINLVIDGHMAYDHHMPHEVSGDGLGGTLSTAKVPPTLPPVPLIISVSPAWCLIQQ